MEYIMEYIKYGWNFWLNKLLVPFWQIWLVAALSFALFICLSIIKMVKNRKRKKKADELLAEIKKLNKKLEKEDIEKNK